MTHSVVYSDARAHFKEFHTYRLSVVTSWLVIGSIVSHIKLLETGASMSHVVYTI